MQREKMQGAGINVIKNRLFSSKEVLTGFYFPVQKFTHNSSIIKEFEANKGSIVVATGFSRIEIRNRLLTENHYRVLTEIIDASKLEMTPLGLRAIFSEREVMRSLGMGDNNHTQLRELVKQIADATFYLGMGRQRRVKIIDFHIIEEIGMQTVHFSNDYVEMNQLDFAISSTTLSKKLRDLRVSTIPSIIRYIYNVSRGTADYSLKLEDILLGIGFGNSTKSLNTLKSWLKQNVEILEKDFHIIYNFSSKIFLTSKELEDKLTFIQASFDEAIFDKYIGLTLPASVTGKKASKIRRITKLSFREYELETEEGVVSLESFFDDFLAFLEDLS